MTIVFDTQQQDEVLAATAVLTLGPPPKSLVWRPAGFAKNNQSALDYCKALEEFIQSHIPTIKRRRLVIRRNRVLRVMYVALGRPMKH